MVLSAVGICTYRRPDGLRSVLSSLQRQRPGSEGALNAIVIVVDNSPEGSARDICSDFGSESGVNYVHEPRKGLSNARNAAIEAALRLGAARIAFIDDDEMATEHWLAELSECMDRAGSIVAAGPTFPLFAEPPTSWIPIEAYAYTAKVRGGIAHDASSANMLIDLQRLNSLGLKFEAEFNESGGEDTQLMARLAALGEKIAWAEKAIVWDQIPQERMRPAWLFRRWYRTGITESRVLTPGYQTVYGRLLNIAKGSARVAYGAVRVAVGAVRGILGSPSSLIASCYTIFRGLGYLAGAFGHSFKEYSAKRYR